MNPHSFTPSPTASPPTAPRSTRVATKIRKVAVLGAGVMGQGIAAHLANAGIPSVLFDMVPRDLPAGAPRSKLAIEGIQNLGKLKPKALYRKDGAALVTPANYDDDAGLLAECDWIVEVVVELLAVKKKVFSWVATHRRPDAIVSSNTSGLSLADMAADMPADMRRHFLVTHFFNPVRYMRLLELVAGPDTDPAVTAAIAAFGTEKLGKGIVYAKDTPNFIANRIGTYGILSVFQHMGAHGLDVPAVDLIMGPPMGRPKSAVFRTLDLVGVDTVDHVFRSVMDHAPQDEKREMFRSPPFLVQMIEERALGEKTGKGFFQKVKGADGKSEILVRDLATGTYGPQSKPRFEAVKKAKNASGPGPAIKAMVNTDDAAGRFAWATTADVLIYAANRIPEIADDIVNIDRGMRWGFAWDLGPFETWDALGVAETVARMKQDGLAVPAWVEAMLAAGRSSFYARGADGVVSAWDPRGSAAPVEQPATWLILDDLKARDRVVEKNFSASLYDLGDGVAGLRFHSKMNAIDDAIIGMYNTALDQLDAGRWQALVVGNQGGNAFCAGANIMMVAMAAMQGEWAQLEAMIKGLQDTLVRAKHSARPVVTAPWGLTLGGGAEIAMQSSATVAAGELYMGLVEVGVGLIPAGGGCKEMLARYLGDIPAAVDFDPNPFVQAAFKNIGLASVAESAEEARDMRYLRPQDRLCLDPDALVADAKKLALGMVAGGYQAPARQRFRVPGPSGRAAIELFLFQMHEGGYATDHDLTVGKKLAHVMTGGDVPANTVVDEQHILDLEREAFLSLCGTQQTIDRIQHMLTTGKPLRN
jgi:3-hydroxyacyl-CoA dehydrogenase